LTLNLDPTAAAAAITPRTRAILPVDFAGRPADLTRLGELARAHRLAMIEDAAHCVEGIEQGVKVGCASDLTCFSFYATKNLTTGEGGMVTTSRADWADRMRTLSLHGMSRDAWMRYRNLAPTSYDVAEPGFKYNLTDLQAAIGIHQLAHLERRL